MLSVTIATCALPANVTELPDVDVDDTGYTGTIKSATSSSCGPLSQNFTLLFSDDEAGAGPISSKLLDVAPSSASIVSADRSAASADEATLTHASKTMQLNCASRAHIRENPAENSEQNELFRPNNNTEATKPTA